MPLQVWAGPLTGGEVRKTPFLRHFILKTVILPRQARDKHRENLKEKKRRFVAGGGASAEYRQLHRDNHSKLG